MFVLWKNKRQMKCYLNLSKAKKKTENNKKLQKEKALNQDFDFLVFLY